MRISNRAPRLRGTVRLEDGELFRGFPVWLVAAIGAAGGIGLILLFRETKPKSMPITLPGTRQEFMQLMRQAVRASLPGASPETERLIIAHAAYESGWGKSSGWKNANNPFNLTALSGPSIPGPDTECDANNNCKPITQKWAVFPSIAAGTVGYLKFIRAARYTDAYSRLINGDASFLDALSRGGYFTQPLSIYKTNFLSVLNRVANEMAV